METLITPDVLASCEKCHYFAAAARSSVHALPGLRQEPQPRREAGQGSSESEGPEWEEPQEASRPPQPLRAASGTEGRTDGRSGFRLKMASFPAGSVVSGLGSEHSRPPPCALLLATCSDRTPSSSGGPGGGAGRAQGEKVPGEDLGEEGERPEGRVGWGRRGRGRVQGEWPGRDGEGVWGGPGQWDIQTGERAGRRVGSVALSPGARRGLAWARRAGTTRGGVGGEETRTRDVCHWLAGTWARPGLPGRLRVSNAGSPVFSPR